MKSATESLGPTRLRLTVEVPFEELRPSVDAAYRKIAGQVTVPGFRKGRVPPAIIDQRFGRAVVLEEAVNEALPTLYQRAIEDNEVEPLGQPQVDLKQFADGSELAFTAEVDVRPEVTLPEYDGLEATVDEVQVTDEDIDEHIDAIRERFVMLGDVERPVETGDQVTIDLLARKDGEEVAGAQAEAMTYVVGEGSLLDGIDEALVGLSVGETTTFRSQLAGGPRSGEEVDVEVTLRGVQERHLPDLDDEFAQTASEFDTVEEFRADVRSALERVRRVQQASAARDAVLEKLLALVDVPLPESTVQAEIEARRQSVREQLAYSGLDEESYLRAEGQTPEEYAADLEHRVRQSLTAQFVLDAVGKAEALSVSEAELGQHLARRARRAGMRGEDFAREAVAHGQVPLLVGEAARAKALAHLVEHARVTDTAGNPVEIAEPQPEEPVAAP